MKKDSFKQLAMRRSVIKRYGMTESNEEFNKSAILYNLRLRKIIASCLKKARSMEIQENWIHYIKRADFLRSCAVNRIDYY